MRSVVGRKAISPLQGRARVSGSNNGKRADHADHGIAVDIDVATFAAFNAVSRASTVLMSAISDRSTVLE